MNVQYFKVTDTLYIEFRPAEIVESRDLDSTSKPYGRYGSKYSSESINNPYGAGSPYKADSPTNPYGEGMW